MLWQPPHYPELIEAAGYRRNYPMWIFDVDFASERYRQASQAALANPACHIRALDPKRWDEDIELLRTLWVETFADEWEFHDLTPGEWREFMGQLKWLLDEHQVQFAEVDGEAVGFAFGMPDLSPLLRSLHGSSGPLQIFRLLRHGKRLDGSGLIGIGVRESQRGKRVGQTLAASLWRHYEQHGLKRSRYFPVNDENLASRRFAENFGGQGRILYHTYDKALSP
jgi:GNAT superfamily N-acetyltransferase